MERGRPTGPGPRLHRPRGPLADHIEFFGHWLHRGSSYRSRALPRGAVTVVFDVGPRQRLDFYAADGTTEERVPPAFLTGPQNVSYVSDIAADEPVMAIHFRPGGAFPFLGMSLGDLAGAPVGVDEIWGGAGRELHERLIEAPSIPARFALLERFMLSRMGSSRQPSLGAALAAIEADPSVRLAELRRLTGLSSKRLVALFRAEVGLAPKEFARARRFQAALRRLGEDAGGGARIAADLGYFDQSHLVREFRAFSGMTPTSYRRRRILLPSHVPFERRKNPRPPGSGRR
ncbi:AraC family transcriptional regulator [Mycobacterium sp. 1245499.0]|nr:AraC family transcriptional regulator [Mycobacterium sp. 1245801.1]OBL12187.1 AraC family transcriptional regulator [Mycobacterium sp. 1245499.0]